MFELFIITIVFIGVALIALSIRMLFIRGSKFPETHISQNKEMKNRGISCYKAQEKLERITSAIESPSGDFDYNCNCSDNSCHIDLKA